MAKSKVEWVNLSKSSPNAPAVKINLGEVSLKPECAGKTESGKRVIMYKGTVETPFGPIPVKLTLDVQPDGTPVPKGKVPVVPATLPSWAQSIKLA